MTMTPGCAEDNTKSDHMEENKNKNIFPKDAAQNKCCILLLLVLVMLEFCHSELGLKLFVSRYLPTPLLLDPTIKMF